MSGFIPRRLKLKVNRAKSAVARRYRFTAGRERRRRIAPKTVERLKEKIRELTPRTRGVNLDRRAEEVGRYLWGWIGYYRFCQTPSVLHGLERWLRGSVRFAELRKRGVGRDLAANGGQRSRSVAAGE